MTNKSKAKGTRAETKVVKYFESRGFGARRKALAGNKDEGDVELFDAPRLYCPITIEVKGGKQTANPNRTQLTEWLRQAAIEKDNAGSKQKAAYLIVVRYNRRIEDADVWIQYTDGDGYFTKTHMYLDEFASEYE